ncbi:MAG: tRNA 4-thiouridine(8) synthase ThiI [archaeon]|nr:tRNA 4-thiouridine(8) synthase ThiI [archaeon]
MRFVTLLSDGIDSPVASYVMSRAGASVILLHMCIGSHDRSGKIEKIKLIARRLEEVTGRYFPLYVANHEKNQAVISEKCERSYRCVLCKRVMQHVAREFAKENGCTGIIMGDSVGQVASQTLRNIRVEEQDLNYPIIRPLVGMDKSEIIDIAKRIGTFDISVAQTYRCDIVPLKPVIGANSEKVLDIQESLNFNQMIRDSVNSIARLN